MSFGRNDGGEIHDRVTTSNGVAITVIAGSDASDTLGFLIHGAGLSASLVISAQDARRLGSLLLEAAADTLSREATP